jgi:hypothetical protein
MRAARAIFESIDLAQFPPIPSAVPLLSVLIEAARCHTAAASKMACEAIAFASGGFAMPPHSAIALCESPLSGQVVATVGENERLTMERVVFVAVVERATCICCAATTHLEARAGPKLGCSR